MKTKKIDREFLITDETVNCYGFRLLTTGFLIDEFKKNPIGYHMHNREDGVLVRWDDLRVEGDKVFGKPVINLSNERGEQTATEVEERFLNGASVGHIVALEYSEDPALMLPGQYGPTITKWYCRECSLVDVPGNNNALAALFDKDGNQINLADFKTKLTNTTTLNMKQIILTAEQLAKVPNLKADATADDVLAHVNNLAAEAAKVPQLQTDLQAATDAKKTAEDALAALKGNVVNDLVDAAVAETRCTKEAGELLKKQYEGKPDDLKALLATMKPYQPVTSQLAATGTDNTELAELSKLSGEELFKKEGAFDRLKELSLPVFKVKYKECFGEEFEEAK